VTDELVHGPLPCLRTCAKLPLVQV
jgi:hypothetical protein